jgi:hypothetical protein
MTLRVVVQLIIAIYLIVAGKPLPGIALLATLVF